MRGTYAADTLLNGKGIAGADGTGVYLGMAAAPQSYEFGTRIVFPGIGTVTVHDRGGAITELETGAHRLDLWMGYGEEGLARALRLRRPARTGDCLSARRFTAGRIARSFEFPGTSRDDPSVSPRGARSPRTASSDR